MNERPILFSTPMVKALLAGNKTETRRIIKPQPESIDLMGVGTSENKTAIQCNSLQKVIKCPYGKPGDLLWVRESYSFYRYAYFFKADEPHIFKGLKYKPSIHMPKDFARIWLKITNIKVERLQDISSESAIAEGIELLPDGTYQNYLKKIKIPSWPTAYHSFQSLWESIHGSESWDENPWLWVVEFKVISTNGKPSNI